MLAISGKWREETIRELVNNLEPQISPIPAEGDELRGLHIRSSSFYNNNYNIYNNMTKSKQKLLISECGKEDIRNEERAEEIQSLIFSQNKNGISDEP